MFDIEIIKKGDINVVSSKLLHKKLKVRSYHAEWIRRRIDGYGFIEGQDYFIRKMSKSIGRPSLDYLITLDMGKELAMLENNDIGKATRKYFIKCEKKLRKLESIRLAGIQVRKSLTDKLQESGENERMHGHGISAYTRLIYSITDLSFRYKEYSRHTKKEFRDTLTGEDLKRVELAESIVKPLLEMDKQYAEIKDILKPLFEVKEIKG